MAKLIKFKYNIKKILKIDYNNIELNNNSNIFVCIYKINFDIDTKKIKSPFLQYLLYKYPNNNSNLSNKMIFPFIKYKTGDNILKKSNQFVKNIIGDDLDNIGYLNDKNDIYVFYNYDNNQVEVTELNKNNQFWWCLIDEICNRKKLINFPILKKVYLIFYKYPELIYLKNSRGKNLEIPIVGYFGSSYELTSFTASLGLRSSSNKIFGSFYYFGDFVSQVRYGGWTNNYKKHMLGNKPLTDENGKYVQGGVVRFALFLGENSRVVFYNKNDNMHWWINHLDNNMLNDTRSEKIDKMVGEKKGLWAKKYDSLIMANLKFKKTSGYFNKNTKYIIKDFIQQTPLSIHKLDMTTLKDVWDSEYNFYDIK